MRQGDKQPRQMEAMQYLMEVDTPAYYFEAVLQTLQKTHGCRSAYLKA